MFDYLFVLTEFSENEGEQILCEANTLADAWDILCDKYGFKERELRFVERMSVEEGEWLGLDTY